MHSMRIAIVSTPFIRVPPTGYGGTELFCYELAEELHARGHDVTLFTTADSISSTRRRALYQHPVWPPNPSDEVIHAAWALADIEREGFDVAHFNSALGLPFGRFVSTPIVHTIHHGREEPISRLYASCPQVAFVAISRRQLELETPLASATVIHHGVSSERYPPSDRDEGYLLHLGRWAHEKGTHLAVDAARAAGLPIKLAGRVHSQDRGYFERELRPRFALPGVTEVGEANYEQKLALLRGAAALLCPLQWEEPFGLVAIEAMFCGTPIVGFARGAFPEIVDEGVTGFLAPDDDVSALAALASGLGRFDRRACARRARERFSIAAMTDAYERLYARVAGRRAIERARAA